MAWMNGDGLNVKFGKEEGALGRGGENAGVEGIHQVDIVVDWTDLLSATPAILGSIATLTGSTGGFGVELPKGGRIEEVEVLVLSAFTSSGTIGSSTLVMGLKKSSDRSTELDHDGFTTASFVGGVLDAAGERTTLVVGGTGAGALIGTTLAENGVFVVSNSAHASHPYTAGKALVRITYNRANVTA